MSQKKVIVSQKLFVTEEKVSLQNKDHFTETSLFPTKSDKIVSQKQVIVSQKLSVTEVKFSLQKQVYFSETSLFYRNKIITKKKFWSEEKSP